METLKEILEALQTLSEEELSGITDEQRTQASALLGIEIVEGDESEYAEQVAKLTRDVENRDERIAVLLDENKQMSTELEAVKAEQHAKRKAGVIDAALADGKILPKNRDKWEAMFDKDPDGVADLLSEKGSEVDLSERGSAAGGGEGDGVELSDEDKAAAKMAGMTIEEYAEVINGRDK